MLCKGSQGGWVGAGGLLGERREVEVHVFAGLSVALWDACYSLLQLVLLYSLSCLYNRTIMMQGV